MLKRVTRATFKRLYRQGKIKGVKKTMAYGRSISEPYNLDRFMENYVFDTFMDISTSPRYENGELIGVSVSTGNYSYLLEIRGE
jgi:hypothetical protein